MGRVCFYIGPTILQDVLHGGNPVHDAWLPRASRAPHQCVLAGRLARARVCSRRRAAVYMLKRADGVVLRREENRTRPRDP
jgi:hypothetical protein